MSDMGTINSVLSLILTGASGYGLYKIPPVDKPYAFTACLIGLAHGLIHVYGLIFGEEESVKQTSSAVLELIPLPLVNIELFFATESNNIALGHGLFMVPLALNFILNVIRESEESEAKDTLIHLSILGNCTSLLYLAINDSSYWLGGMALLAFLAKYGAMFIESNFEGTGETVNLICNSGFFYMTAEAVSGES